MSPIWYVGFSLVTRSVSAESGQSAGGPADPACPVPAGCGAAAAWAAVPLPSAGNPGSIAGGGAASGPGAGEEFGVARGADVGPVGADRGPRWGPAPPP